jgi:hypothetical protein
LDATIRICLKRWLFARMIDETAKAAMLNMPNLILGSPTRPPLISRVIT